MTAYDHTEHSVHDWQPTPGDQGFVAGKAWVSGAIKWFTRGRKEPPTFASHVFCVRDRLTLAHAVWPRLKREPAKVYVEELCEGGYDFIILGRTQPPTCGEVLAVQREIDSWFNDGARWLPRRLKRFYAFGEFPLQGIDGLLMKAFGGNIVFARKLQDLLPNVVCSGFAAWCRIAAGWAPLSERFDSPDDSLDRAMLDSAWTVKAMTYGAAKMIQRHINQG